MEYEFISCGVQLPPTECPLVIQIPARAVIRGEGGRSLCFDRDMTFRAHRLDHIETKERDMRFELESGMETMWFIGRPGWSYP